MTVELDAKGSQRPGSPSTLSRISSAPEAWSAAVTRTSDTVRAPPASVIAPREGGVSRSSICPWTVEEAFPTRSRKRAYTDFVPSPPPSTHGTAAPPVNGCQLAPAKAASFDSIISEIPLVASDWPERSSETLAVAVMAALRRPRRACPSP